MTVKHIYYEEELLNNTMAGCNHKPARQTVYRDRRSQKSSVSPNYSESVSESPTEPPVSDPDDESVDMRPTMSSMNTLE